MDLNEKKHFLKNAFIDCPSKESIYRKVMELGKDLPPMDPKYKNHLSRVSGCQSETHIHPYTKNDQVFFEADSDALIAKGLAYLIITFYSGLTPKEILLTKPLFLEELGITSSLSMNRANGVAQMILFIQKSAARFLGIPLS
ncbi:MAG: SufE family protein [Chlamydiota bacterium]